MKTKITILVDNIKKRVYQNIYTGNLYIKHKGEMLDCKWFDDDTMQVAFYGFAKVEIN